MYICCFICLLVQKHLLTTTFLEAKDVFTFTPHAAPAPTVWPPVPTAKSNSGKHSSPVIPAKQIPELGWTGNPGPVAVIRLCSFRSADPGNPPTLRGRGVMEVEGVCPYEQSEGSGKDAAPVFFC